ncbi:MFS transporter [Micrococcus sp. 2A]|uniref:MFS transporter n=1 Tax=Micrococcus sp. 2A TaxID=3142261 RepID=UPI00262F63C0|nr:MFS transporter [uncultured Micrococcus sp.]
MSTTERIYSCLVTRSPEAEARLPEQVRRDVPANGLRLVGANTLQSSGDQIVNASTVLPWLFAALGVPPALTGLLKPIRESLSMLPQAFLTPLVLRARRRKRVFALGALVQAGSVAAMAATAALGTGLAAGVLILAALAVFSLGRCLCSISSKDVQGRVVPPGERGQITGLATTASGLVAITLGLGIRGLGGGSLDAGALAGLLTVGAALWVAVAGVSLTLREPAEDPEEGGKEADDDGGDDGPLARRSWALLREDRDFRQFVTVRSLLLVSSLSPPFIVMLALDAGTDALAGLGGFVIASGVASLVGGRLFGRFADRSSRLLMAVTAAIASAVIVAVVVLAALPAFRGGSGAGGVLLVSAYFLLTLAHTGVRVGRKTYLMDMASGDTRTVYTAVSNTAMGVILLVVGAISAALAAASATWALLLLAALGAAGVVAGLRLPEVSRG